MYNIIIMPDTYANLLINPYFVSCKRLSDNILAIMFRQSKYQKGCDSV